MRMLTADETVRRRWLSLMTMMAHSGSFFSEPHISICTGQGVQKGISHEIFSTGGFFP
jgi:hypothetical protein